MDFSPADLFRSTKTGSRSSLDRVNKQLSASRGTFRQKVHIGVLVATVALVAYGAIIIWSASQFKADASFSRHLLGIGIGAVLAVLVWRTDLRGISNFSTALLVIDLIVILSPKIPGLSYTGGLGMTGWIKIPGIGLTFQPVELAKLITIFFIATLGSQYNGRIDTVRAVHSVFGRRCHGRPGLGPGRAGFGRHRHLYERCTPRMGAVDPGPARGLGGPRSGARFGL